jgi:hypothetical protein
MPSLPMMRKPERHEVKDFIMFVAVLVLTVMGTAIAYLLSEYLL